MENVVTQHITKTAGICGGRACIAGHRIRVQDIVVWHEMRDCSVAQIVEMFPGLTKADVHAALAYYFDKTEEIQSEFPQRRGVVQWAEANAPSQIPPELKVKLGG